MILIVVTVVHDSLDVVQYEQMMKVRQLEESDHSIGS